MHSNLCRRFALLYQASPQIIFFVLNFCFFFVEFTLSHCCVACLHCVRKASEALRHSLFFTGSHVSGSASGSVNENTKMLWRTLAVITVAEAVIPRASRTTHESTHAGRTRPLVAVMTAVRDVRIPARVGRVRSRVCGHVHWVTAVSWIHHNFVISSRSITK